MSEQREVIVMDMDGKDRLEIYLVYRSERLKVSAEDLQSFARDKNAEIHWMPGIQKVRCGLCNEYVQNWDVHVASIKHIEKLRELDPVSAAILERCRFSDKICVCEDDFDKKNTEFSCHINAKIG